MNSGRGADWQLLRPDGAKELDALHGMRVRDGTVPTHRNRGIIDESVPGPRDALPRIHATAPGRRRGWLDRRVIPGTLHSARPVRGAVLIRGRDAGAGIPA